MAMVIKPVQYLRGLAALMVVWQHASGQIVGMRELLHIPQIGGYGVDLFFGISGFIMLVTTWEKSISPGQFLLNRVQRIVPLYWLATLVMVAGALIAPQLFYTLKFDWPSLLKSLFFIPYYSLSFPEKIAPLLVPGWSLNYEMFFYLLFAGALLFRREDRILVMIYTLTALRAVGMALESLQWKLWPIVQVYTSPRLLEFGVGVLIARWYLYHRHRQSENSWLAPIALLGDASYSIYLSHIFALGVLRIVWTHFVTNVTLNISIAFMGTALLICAFVGWLCYRLVELPIINKLKRARS
jgi:exopolysaccharide production protein ExoZ